MTYILSTPHFLDGPGETRALINTTDWRDSPLGVPADWPAELVTVVRLMLSSAFPMFVAWGPQLGFLYNDAYARILGAKHPHAFGQPFAQIWAEIWPAIGPIVDNALAGRSSYFDDLPLTLQRKGYVEQTWFTFSYSPLQDAGGAIGGMCCTCVETTERVLSEQRQAFQLALADRLRPLRAPDDVTEAATALLGGELQAARCFYADLDQAGQVLEVRQDWVGGALPSLAGKRLTLADFGPAVIAAVTGGEAMVVDDVQADARTAPTLAAYAAVGVRAFVAIPVIKGGALIAILSLHHHQPRRWSATELTLARDTVERTWAAVEQAHAEQQRRLIELERERLLRELGTVNARMAEVFRQAPAFMCVLRGPQHVFEMVNARYLELVGGRDLIGKRLLDALPELHDQGYLELLDEVYRSGQPFVGIDMQVELVRAPNAAPALRHIDLAYMALLDADGQVTGVLVHGVDQTERKLAESALRASEERYRSLAADLAEADQRKTEFLATLAHELRNPLAPIRSGLSVMQLGAANPAAVEKVRAMMDRQVSHMVRLIDDLLDIARIGGGKLELIRAPVLLADVLASAVETSMPLIERWRHQLTVTLPPQPVRLYIDATRTAQVIANLLNNAAKYTPAGGQIALAASVREQRVQISVTDNGIGIPADALPHVFEMFNQVGRHRNHAHGGLGIGLALVRQLVLMHDGSVEAASAGPDQGSVFTVCLPLPADHGASAAVHQPSAHAQRRPGTRRIMVVDDNVDAAEALAAALELDGHQVRVAHGGREALATASAFAPDVAFLDIGMPGMDGYAVARALRVQFAPAELMLVALTGWGAAHDRVRARDAGFDHHLTKPAELAAVQRLLA